MDVKLGRSERGSDMLSIDGYLYHFAHSGLHAYHWVCSKKKEEKCRVRVKTTLLIEDDLRSHKVESMLHEHTHPPAEPAAIMRCTERRNVADQKGEPLSISFLSQPNTQRKRSPTKKQPIKDNKTISPTTLCMLRTVAGTRLVTVGGYIYHYVAQLQSGTQTWDCVRSRDFKCNMRLLTNCGASGRYKIKLINGHLHNHKAYSSAQMLKLLQVKNISIISKHTDVKQHDNRQYKAITSTKLNSAQTELEAEVREEQEKSQKLLIAKALCLKQVHSNEAETKAEAAAASAKCDTAAKQTVGKYETEEDNEDDDSDDYMDDPLFSPHGKEAKRLSYSKSFQFNKDPLSALQDDDVKSEQISFTFLPSAKGNQVICLQKHIYHLDSRSACGKRTYWTCLLRRDKAFLCKARLTTQNGKQNVPMIVHRAGEHKHAECIDDIKYRLSKLKGDHVAKLNIIGAKRRYTKTSVKQEKNTSQSKNATEKDIKFETLVFDSYDDFMETAKDEQLDVGSNVDSLDAQDVDSLDYNMFKPKVHTTPKPIMLADVIDTATGMNLNKVSIVRNYKSHNKLLCVDDYLYVHQANKPLGNYWVCLKHQDKMFKCPSSVYTVRTLNGEWIVQKASGRHTHLPDKKPKIADNSMEVDQKYSIKEMMTNSNDDNDYIDDDDDDDFNINKYVEIKRKIRSTMKLYSVSDGPPSLAVRMTLKALKIQHDLINVDYCASEHMTEKYAKMNPQKEIPVLDDNGFYLSESVAIMQYLCDKHAPQSALYPRDAINRALVNQRLCFNMNFYYASISAYAMAPIFFDYPRNELGLKKVKNALQVFETYLERNGHKYAAAEHLTLADLALVSATICLEAIDFDLSPYKRVKKWYATFKEEQPELWEISKGGMEEIAAFDKNPPDLSHMNHPFHPTRKLKK